MTTQAKFGSAIIKIICKSLDAAAVTQRSPWIRFGEWRLPPFAGRAMERARNSVDSLGDRGPTRCAGRRFFRVGQRAARQGV
jgi:hypothetical protein